MAWAPAVAAAHVDPEPAQVPAGRTTTVALHIEHGCDGSPTTEVSVGVPGGVTDMAGVAKDGWAVEDGASAVTFRGGPLEADTRDHFDVTFTAPMAPGVIHLPVVQTCVQGELPWIAIAEPGQPEPEHPAPSVEVVPAGDDPTVTAATTLAAASDPGSATAATTTEVGAASETSGAPRTPTTDPASADGDEEGTDLAPVIIGGAGVVAIAAGVIMLLRRRAGGTG